MTLSRDQARQEVANLQRRAEHAAQELEDALDAVEAVTKERDGLREQLANEVRMACKLSGTVAVLRSEMAMRQREHAALFADANAARVKAEQERYALLQSIEAQRKVFKEDNNAHIERAYDAERALAEARQEADMLRRQVKAMSAPIAAACSRFGHLDMVLEMAHDPDGTEGTNPWHACARDLWRAVKAAKEAVTEQAKEACQ
jgi:chromosome segregation ATPase